MLVNVCKTTASPPVVSYGQLSFNQYPCHVCSSRQAYKGQSLVEVMSELASKARVFLQVSATRHQAPTNVATQHMQCSGFFHANASFINHHSIQMLAVLDECATTFSCTYYVTYNSTKFDTLTSHCRQGTQITRCMPLGAACMHEGTWHIEYLTYSSTSGNTALGHTVALAKTQQRCCTAALQVDDPGSSHTAGLGGDRPQIRKMAQRIKETWGLMQVRGREGEVACRKTCRMLWLGYTRKHVDMGFMEDGGLSGTRSTRMGP